MKLSEIEKYMDKQPTTTPAFNLINQMIAALREIQILVSYVPESDYPAIHHKIFQIRDILDRLEE